MEFLVGAFLRFMKWSNIIDLSYASSCSSSLKPGNKVLNQPKSTCDASWVRRSLLQGTACPTADHIFLKIRFGAWEEGDAERWWRMGGWRVRAQHCSGGVWGPLAVRFCRFGVCYSFCVSFFWDLTSRWYLWGDCSFSRKGESWRKTLRAGTQSSCGN